MWTIVVSDLRHDAIARGWNVSTVTPSGGDGRRVRDAGLLFVIAVFGIACVRISEPPPEPLKIVSVELGTAVDQQNRVATPTRTFAPENIVYVSIGTKGVGHGTLVVDWATGSKIIETQKREIDPRGPEHFEFHFMPSQGWPNGTNRVRFALNEGEQHLAEFWVQQAMTPASP